MTGDPEYDYLCYPINELRLILDPSQLCVFPRKTVYDHLGIVKKVGFLKEIGLGQVRESSSVLGVKTLHLYHF